MEWYHDVLPGRLLAWGVSGVTDVGCPLGLCVCWAVGGWGRRAALSPRVPRYRI